MLLTRTRSTLFSLILLHLFIAACSTTIEQPTIRPPETPKQELLRLYNQAQQSSSPESEKYRLQAAKLLISLNRLGEAQTILQNLTVRNLPDSLRTEYALSSATLALQQFDANHALTILNRYRSLLYSEGNEILIRATHLKAKAYQLQGQYSKSASQLIRITPLLSDTDSPSRMEKIWSLLMLAPIEQINVDIGKRPDSAVVRGWLELAQLIKQDRNNLDKQLALLTVWRERWGSHPAAITLPDELQLLEAIANNRPNKITLLLPLNGANRNAGRAIRDGFFSAYYAALGDQGHTPSISILDTSATNDFLPLYQQAIADKPDLIIGPLEKQKVQQLQSLPHIAIPTLALNYADISKPNLFQFGLSAEDEAQQVAQQAWQDGHRYALVLAPDTDWGKRTAAAFTLEWKNLQATLLETQYYPLAKNYSKTIKLLLNINQSEDRARLIKKLAKTRINFTPRRREDFDFIFIIATPEDARQIKPTLAFHFAGKMPVYATSHIYSGVSAPLLDRDLDGILFCEAPWMLKPQYHKFRGLITQLWPETANRYGRLYALGVDSYRLASRLKQFELLHSTNIQGATGLLSMEGPGYIHRTLDWAKIRRGKITPLD